MHVKVNNNGIKEQNKAQKLNNAESTTRISIYSKRRVCGAG